MKKGVIFDFNGTLFWDTKFQNSSWDQYLENHNVFLSEEEKRLYVHGRNGKDTFEYIFKRELSKSEVAQLIEEKEILYRAECLKHKMELAPGAGPFIEYLLSKDITIAIATASGKANVDFFIENLDLLKYFKEENIIYDDGSIRGKPFPDLFEKAIQKIRIHKSNVVIFEDSIAGIKAAENSGAGKIVIVNSNNESYDLYDYLQIRSFDNFDRRLI